VEKGRPVTLIILVMLVMSVRKDDVLRNILMGVWMRVMDLMQEWILAVMGVLILMMEVLIWMLLWIHLLILLLMLRFWMVG